MKLWPQSKMRKILVVPLVVMLAVLGSVGGYFEYSVYREISTPTNVLNPLIAETALIIYHPGLTDYARNVTYTYANGLAAAGWRVEIATASPQAPTDISNYKLLVLTWALYDFNPAPTITSQVHRIGNLNGTNTVILVIGGGMDPLNAKEAMKKIVQDANGTILQSLTAFRSNRNLTNLYDQASQIAPRSQP